MAQPRTISLCKDQLVRRYDVLDILQEALDTETGQDIGDFVDELFGDRLEMTVAELLSWFYVSTIRIIAATP